MRRFVAAAASVLMWGADASAAPVLMRQPTTSATQLAFVARGDLWVSPRDGGRAIRLVHSDGAIVTARFSPDGRWIAYTERRDGGQDVLVVPAAGGAPRRLTFDAPAGTDANLVVGWTPDGTQVVFLSDRGAVARGQIRAFLAPLTGGMARPVPVDSAGRLSFSPDGGSIAFTRTFNDTANRKRYVGGRADDLFRYDLAQHRLERLTDWRGTDTAPMWVGRRLYFLSDRGAGFRLNLWVRDMDTGAVRQVTHFRDFDIDAPSYGAGRIVFQQGGALWALDLDGERQHPIRVDVPDDGARTAARDVDAGGEVRTEDATGAINIAASAGALVLAAHGDLFRVPVGGGTPFDLTATPGIDEDHPALSPDGRTVAYITENDRAQQVAVRPLAGGPERLLTRFTTGVLYRPVFSADGASLLIADTQHHLWLVSTAGRSAPRLVAQDPVAEIRDTAFSPDGRWLTYSTMRSTGQHVIHVQPAADGRDQIVSSPMEDDRNPRFSADGRRLVFISRRNELPLISDRDDEASFVAVASDGLFSLPVPATQDWSPAMAQAVRLPAAPSRITSLEVRGDALFYETQPPALIGGDLPGGVAQLHRLDSKGDTVVLAGFDVATVSDDGTTIAALKDGKWLSRGRDAVERPIDLSALRLGVEPRREWAEMFERTWKLYRDSFFSPIMNGDDWQAVHDAYARFVPLLGSREDARWLIGQLQGELATSHAFLVNSDPPGTKPRNTPRLGADLALDAASGRYRFARVFQGDPTRERFRAPLNAPSATGEGIHVAAGEYLLAVNGVELRTPIDPDRLLADSSGLIRLSVAPTATGVRRELTIEPLARDTDLRQHDWIEANRARVDRMSGGRIGYLFVSDFAEAGSEDLFRQLQGQLDKQGLVVDVRWNNGGYTSQAVLNLLRRVHAGGFANREGAMEPLPRFVAPRAMAAIANADTASDGDQFAYYFRRFGLGPVIGQRTWGGVQGISGLVPLIDGSKLTIAKDSLASSDGHWLIENVGAEPDIAVDPAPDEAETGDDRLLDTAVAEVSRRIAAQPEAPLRAPAPLPAYPAKGDVPPATILKAAAG